MKKIFGWAVVGSFALFGCQQEQPQRAGSSESNHQTTQSLEHTNPHTMGGTGGSGTENVPPKDLSVGAGSNSDQQEPQLQSQPAGNIAE